MNDYTPARDADVDHVLFAPGATRSQQSPPVHLPSEGNSDRPRCGTERITGDAYRRKAPHLCPQKWRVCTRCDPDHEPGVGGGSGTPVAKLLEDADPDDVSRETAGEA